MLANLVSFAAAALMEGLSIKALFAAAQSVAQVLLWHIASVLVSVPGWRGLFPVGYAKSGWTFTALVVGLAGTLPAVGFLLLAGLRVMLALRVAQRPDQRYILGTRRYLTEETAGEIAGESPRSIIEILHGASPKARRNAILALRDVEPKKALPLLQKAIQDSDEQVRLLAQTQFNRIIAGLELAIKQLEAELAHPPRPLSKLLHLAEQYHELVYLGLSSEETQKIHLDRAIELLREAAPHAPDNPAVPFLMMRCFLKNEDVAQARVCLKQLQSRGWGKELTVGWEAEIHFLERDWAALGRCLRQLQATPSTAPALRETVEFWLCPAPVR